MSQKQLNLIVVSKIESWGKLLLSNSQTRNSE